MQSDLADYCVDFALSKGASYAEARLEERDSNGFLLKNGLLESAGFDSRAGIGVRFILRNCLGFATVNRLSKEAVRETLSSSLKVTSAASRLTDCTRLASSKAVKAKDVVSCSESPSSVSAEQKTELLSHIDSAVLSSGAKITSRYLSLSDEVVRKYYVNSEGSKIESVYPAIDFFYSFTLDANSRSGHRYWHYGDVGGYECFKHWQLDKVVEREARGLERNLSEAKSVSGRKFDVIAGPEVVGIMVHESVGHPYEADRILGREAAQAGESFVNPSMIGKRIGSAAASVVDDPLAKGFGRYCFDDEGVRAKRKNLVTKGVITEFLHNRETAASLSTASNGASRASDYDKEAIVRMSNTFLLPGGYSEEELFSEVKNGIFIKNFQEWNIDDKRLNQKYVGSEAYFVKNGEIASPAFQPTIEIDTPSLWKAVAACSNKVELHAGECGKGEPMQGIRVSMGGPHCLFKQLRLA